MATFTQQSKNTAVFKQILKHGNATLMSELANFTFEDVVFADGTKLKDITFADLVTQVWTQVSKNSATFTNQTKN